jgi:hypothetical protein
LFIKIEVAHGGKSYNVRPYHEVPEALKLKYESEKDTLLKNLALAKVFKGNLNDPLDWYRFNDLSNWDQIIIATMWLKKSAGLENMKEEPSIVY